LIAQPSLTHKKQRAQDLQLGAQAADELDALDVLLVQRHLLERRQHALVVLRALCVRGVNGHACRWVGFVEQKPAFFCVRCPLCARVLHQKRRERRRGAARMRAHAVNPVMLIIHINKITLRIMSSVMRPMFSF
jgi:hypothetical protein